MANQIYFFSHTKLVSDVQQMEFLYTKMYFKNFVSVQTSTLPYRCIIRKHSLLFQKFAQTEVMFRYFPSQVIGEKSSIIITLQFVLPTNKHLEFLSQTDTKHIR